MTLLERRKIRKIVEMLKVFRDEYAKENNTMISSKFSRAMAILLEILADEKLKEGSK